MTARSIAPAGPATLARRFVIEAERIISRTRAHHPEIEARAAPLRLVCVVGAANWQVIDEDQQEFIDSGRDVALADAARLLTRSAVSELDVESKSRLLASMNSNDEASGTVPGHFRVDLVVEGASWRLRIRAHARGSAATIGTLEGTLDHPVEQDRVAA